MYGDDPFHTLAADYLNLLTNGAAFSDVVFSVEGRQVRAHRCILAARSSFFRMLFCKGETMDSAAAPASPSMPQHIPVGVVGYDVFVLLLQFLYSGQLRTVPEQGRSKCPDRACGHTHCASGVDLALDTLHAASFFGVEQLSIMLQRHLASMVDKIAIDDCMRILVAAKMQGLLPLWAMCSELVARSGLTVDILNKHLPIEIVIEIGELRAQRGIHTLQSGDLALATTGPAHEQRIRRMRQALDVLDVELVRLMVMGEGLDLNKAQALHYSVTNCSRDVVKALLEMGAVNVNYPGLDGKTALHLASEMASPDMISVLLDHHASPRVRADNGDTPFDVVQSLICQTQCSPGARREGTSPAGSYNSLSLCLELLHSAASVADKEDALSDGSVTESDSRRPVAAHSEAQECCSANNAMPTIGRLEELQHSHWASLEGSCSFEPEGDHHLLDDDSIVRLMVSQAHVPSWMPMEGHISLASDGCFLSMYPDLRMAHGETGCKLITTSF